MCELNVKCELICMKVKAATEYDRKFVYPITLAYILPMCS